MRKLTVHLHIWFDDMAAESTEAAGEAIEQALFEMRAHCTEEITLALESIGAKDVRLETVVF